MATHKTCLTVKFGSVFLFTVIVIVITITTVFVITISTKDFI